MFSSLPVTCQFELTRSIYYSGDQVCGKITLSATKKLHLEGIFLNIAGMEHTQWAEYDKCMPILYDDSSTHTNADNKINFKGNKEYILTSVQISEEIELQPGEFVARFHLNLPDQLLPTCNQPNGYVDYHLKVVLQRKNALQKTFLKRLFLRNRVDLNKELNLAEPYITTCALPNNELVFFVPQRGFVPGQHIPFSIKMTQILCNAKIVINLCQKTNYICQMPSSKSKEVIKVHDYYITRNAGSGQLRVPFTTAITTSMDNVLMNISYYLECLVLNEKLEILHQILIPITVGTVALRDRNEFTADEAQRLYTYDNLGATKEEIDECNEQKLVNFDLIACETQKCLQYNKNAFSMAQKQNIQRLWKNLYRKVMTSS